MGHKIGDAVKLKDGSDRVELLREAASLTGIVGDTWSDDRGEHVSVVYETAQVYAYGMPAGEFEAAER